MVSILSFNFNGLPLITRNYSKRLIILGDELIRLQPEIVCIQEIWIKSAGNYLIKRLQEYGYLYHYQPKPDWRFCGFLTMTKGKIGRTETVSLKPLCYTNDRSFVEFPGYKGYALTEITFPPNAKYWLLNLHLAAGWNPKIAVGSDCDKTTSQTVDSLSKAINRLDNNKVILAGDLNFEPDCCCYKQLLNSTHLVDPVPKDTTTILSTLFPIRYINPQKRVDYLLLKNIKAKTNVRVVWNKPVKGIQLSDHAGLLMELSETKA